MTFAGSSFGISFDTASGALVSYQSSGKEHLLAPARPNFWRAVTDNDLGNKHPERCAVWKEVSYSRQLTGFSCRVEGSLGFVTAEYLLDTQPKSLLRVQFEIRTDGSVEIVQVLQPGSSKLPEIPEFGMAFELDSSLDTISWYGRGPHENYWDRQSGAPLGRYSGSVSGQYTPYLRPQECGNKTDVRYASVTAGSDGHGLHVEGALPIEVNALP